jgi:hypothetical protein
MAVSIHNWPAFKKADLLNPNKRRAYIGAYGFEDRSLGWALFQKKGGKVISEAFIFRYYPAKGPNKIEELKLHLRNAGASSVKNIKYSVNNPHELEDELPTKLLLDLFDEVIVDISAMTKLLILLILSHLKTFKGTVRVIYSEAEEYCPSFEEYDPVKGQMAASARFPSRGAEQVIRLRCMSSIRMQGQPMTLVAFTSFNEKLISHMLGSLSPHRLILINGHPPREDYAWRERATQDIHKRLVLEYEADNPIGQDGLLVQKVSTLDYRETVNSFENLYEKHGVFERIVCGATGSKMQTVGLFFCKQLHPDIQVEYPTPDSYFFKDMTLGVRYVHEITIPKFEVFLAEISGADQLS